MGREAENRADGGETDLVPALPCAMPAAWAVP